MAWELSDEKARAVLAWDPRRRNVWAFRQSAEHGAVWGLRRDDTWVELEHDGRRYLPVWPHPRFATAFAEAVGEVASAAAIPLDEFLGRWIRRSRRTGTGIAFFPTSSGEFTPLEPGEASRSLKDALRDRPLPLP